MYKLKSALLATAVFLFINSPIAPQNLPSPFNYKPEAFAKGSSGGGSKGGGSSGGRSRGGSFNQSAPSNSKPKSGNDSGNGSGSNSNNNNAPNNGQGSAPGYRAPVYGNPYPVIINNGSYGSGGYGSNSGSGFFMGLLFLIVAGGSIALLIWWLRSRAKTSQGAGKKSELDNDIVTVTCLQIALLAGARDIQERLIELATETDLTTSGGLVSQLQESVLALLRTPEYWTHGRSTSRTVPNLQEAETLFEQISITERQKFAIETLVNVGGKVRRQEIAAPSELDIPEYIVVTLLVGTADDQPLFPTVHTEEELKAALTRLAAVPPNYLMVFELLWTPAAESDSLTYDQLLANYADMRQLI